MTSHRSALIEDAHQGVTSPAAQRTIDRYRAFVQERRAPIATMDYSPFASAHTRTQHTPLAHQPSYQKSTLLREEVVPASAAYEELNPPIAHTKPGGASWTVDFNNVKVSSKRPSLSGASSRKSSLTDAAQKLWQGDSARGGRNQLSYESAQQIRWAHTSGPASARGSLSRNNEVLSHESGKEGLEQGGGGGAKRFSLTDSHKDAGQFKRSLSDSRDQSQRYSLFGSTGGEKRTSLSDKRVSLSGKQPYLRAHASEARFQVSKPLLRNSLGLGLSQKRASMPPLHNRTAMLLSSNSRRGSVAGQRRPSFKELGALRARSQSLPSDSLFVAYSQCSLPPVMTSSLAALPIPTQPAIPVTVARRYSVLSAAPTSAGQEESNNELAAASADASLAAASEQAVHVNPESIEGIDTSSVLDTTQLQDMPAEDSDEDEQVVPVQPARRGSISRAAMLVESESRQSSPASSPVEGPNGPAAVPAFPLDSTAHGSILSGASNTTSGRSRSMITASTRPGLSVTASGGPGATVPSALAQGGTPDFTPMTSPTNLSNAMFKATLMTRRMSEVVARDVGKKLALLQQTRAQEDQDNEQGDSNQRGQ